MSKDRQNIQLRKFAGFVIKKIDERWIVNRANHANGSRDNCMNMNAIKTGWLVFGVVCAGLCGCAAKERTLPVEVGRAPGRPFPLYVPLDRAVDGNTTPREKGEVRFSWSGQELVVDVRFHDSEIIATGTEDQLQHNELGDVLEIFLQPPGKMHYWELFITPHGRKSSLYWNRAVSAEWDKTPEKRIHLVPEITRFEGTPPGWSARVRIPFLDLIRQGDLSPAEGNWRVLVARQNFTGEVSKKCRELSSFPALDKTNFHATECFVELHLTKGENP